MSHAVEIQTVQPRKLAAVRHVVEQGGVGSAWRPALDLVWAFLRSHPGLRTDGPNIFLYHHPPTRETPMQCDFGVEVISGFPSAGEVFATGTPGGEAAVAVHRGPYSGIPAAHDAIHSWMASNGRESAGYSWEIYGDPAPNPAHTETTIVYLLKPEIWSRQAIGTRT